MTHITLPERLDGKTIEWMELFVDEHDWH